MKYLVAAPTMLLGTAIPAGSITLCYKRTHFPTYKVGLHVVQKITI